ncbi:MAG: hypothetical protein ACOX0D_00015 [Sphaerochaeta sp.]|jgi:hypothetical protein
MSSDQETAKLEIGSKQENRLTTLEAKLKKQERFLVIEKGQNPVFTSCLYRNSSENSMNARDYMVSNYVSQCFVDIVNHNQLDVAGIRYMSVHKEGTYSFVFFNHGESLFDEKSLNIRLDGNCVANTHNTRPE